MNGAPGRKRLWRQTIRQTGLMWTDCSCVHWSCHWSLGKCQVSYNVFTLVELATENPATSILILVGSSWKSCACCALYGGWYYAVLLSDEARPEWRQRVEWPDWVGISSWTITNVSPRLQIEFEAFLASQRLLLANHCRPREPNSDDKLRWGLPMIAVCSTFNVRDILTAVNSVKVLFFRSFNICFCLSKVDYSLNNWGLFWWFSKSTDSKWNE